MGIFPPMDEMLMIEALRPLIFACWSMRGRAARMVWRAPKKLVSMAR